MCLRREKSQSDISHANPHLESFKGDFLYHLNLDKVKDDLKEMFGDVKVNYEN